MTEPHPDQSKASSEPERQYGVFTARYGNIYTTRQALQLFQRAFGEFSPTEEPWAKNGRWIDPFRPTVEPQGFGDWDALQADRKSHLHAVRTMFETAEWLVFTLGLTETWISAEDGAVFPVAPEAIGGTFVPTRHRFINLDFDAVRQDLLDLCDRVRNINPECRIVLTVSPVPLIATFEDRHVLTSTCVSKSILRAAADEVVRSRQRVYYFPAYEMIWSPLNMTNPLQDNLREVTPQAVKHVMGFFRKHFGPTPDERAPQRQQTLSAIRKWETLFAMKSRSWPSSCQLDHL